MPANDPFDLDALRAPDADLAALLSRPSRKPPRHRNGTAFLKGPIPWPWLKRACRLPGKALHVALLLWKEAGCRNNRTVSLCLARAAALGMHPDTARRGLRALAKANLVSIRNRPGRALEITLLEAPEDEPAS
jgi:hypothetical protein